MYVFIIVIEKYLFLFYFWIPSKIYFVGIKMSSFYLILKIIIKKKYIKNIIIYVYDALFYH